MKRIALRNDDCAPLYQGHINENTSVLIEKLTPGAKLLPHTGGSNTLVSLQLGLSGLVGASFVVGQPLRLLKPWQRGLVKAFDDR